MSSRKTPGIYARGAYTLSSPFTIDTTKEYVCIAIRSFDEMAQQGVKVFETIYQPKNISQADYNAHKLQGVAIVALAPTDPTLPIVYVPDNYIASFPNMGTIPYSNLVISLKLGAMADYIGVDSLITQLQNVVSNVIGVTCEVAVHKLPSADAVTPDQHAAIEASREAAITLRTTDYVRNIELVNQATELNTKISMLEQILIDNGLLPPTP